jgi:hypothetical protein
MVSATGGMGVVEIAGHGTILRTFSFLFLKGVCLELAYKTIWLEIRMQTVQDCTIWMACADMLRGE